VEELVNRAFWAGKSVLITGHTGFKGAWLWLWLERLGARLAGYSLEPPTSPSLWALACEGRGQDQVADIRDAQALRAACVRERPEVVFHLAAQSLVKASYDDPVSTYATNVMGTVHLLEAVRACASVRAAIVVTSDKCYDNRETGQAYTEHDPMGGRDPYSSSKGCAELVTAAYRASFFAGSDATRVATVRAGNVIGGGDWADARIIPDTVRAATRNRAVRVRNPAAIRPWQHVLEPLCGYLQLAERLCASSRYAESWNFGPNDADAVSVETIVSTVTRLWGSPARWEHDRQSHPHEAHFLRLDSSKARSKLGWRQRLALHEALAWTVDWYKRQHAGEDARALAYEQIDRYMTLSSR
jgi:CDP-glucose 4,6-dehydratase